MTAGTGPEAPTYTKPYCSWQMTIHWGSHLYTNYYCSWPSHKCQAGLPWHDPHVMDTHSCVHVTPHEMVYPCKNKEPYFSPISTCYWFEVCSMSKWEGECFCYHWWAVQLYVLLKISLVLF